MISALFTDVAPEAVIESLDVDILYEVVLNMQAGMDDVVLKRLGLSAISRRPNGMAWYD